MLKSNTKIKFMKKHRIGVICVEKGRSQKFVDSSQEIGWEILDMFGFMVK